MSRKSSIRKANVLLKFYCIRDRQKERVCFENSLKPNKVLLKIPPDLSVEITVHQRNMQP